MTTVDPENSRNLGSASATVLYEYDDRGMRDFLADGRQAIEIVDELERRRKQTANGKPSAATASATNAASAEIRQVAEATTTAIKKEAEAVGTAVDRLRTQLSRQDLFERLAENAKTSTGKMRRELEQLHEEALGLQAAIDDIGVRSRSQLKPLFNSEGALRESLIIRADRQTSAERGQQSQYGLKFGGVRRDATSLFENLQENADETSRIFKARDTEEVKELVLEADQTFQRLNSVEDKIRALLSAGAGDPDRLAEPFQRARAAVEAFDAATQEAAAAQEQLASAESRIDTLANRYTTLAKIAMAQDDEESYKSVVSRALADQVEGQITEAEARKEQASQRLTAAQQQQTEALAEALRYEREISTIKEREERRAAAKQLTAPAAGTNLEVAATKLATAQTQQETTRIENEARLQERQLQNINAQQTARIEAEANVAAARTVAEQQTEQTRLESEAAIEAARLQSEARVESARTTAAARTTVAEQQANAKTTAAQLESEAAIEAARLQSEARVESARTTAAARTTVAEQQANAKTTAAELASAAKVTAAEIAGDKRVEAAELASAAKVEAAEKSAAGRTTAAKLTGAAKVEAERLASTAKVEAAERAAQARTTAAGIAAYAKIEAERIRSENRIQLQQRRAQDRPGFGSIVGQVAGGFGLATGLEAAVTQSAQFVTNSISLANSLEDSQAAIDGISGSAEQGEQIFKLIQERSRALGANVGETAQAFIPFVAGLKEMPQLFDDAVNRAERLLVANRFQGLGGASFAINEFLTTGDTVSIADRFNLPAAPFKKLRDETREITDVTKQYEARLAGIDQILNDFGLTNEVVAASMDTQAAAFRRAKADIEEAQTSLGNYLALALSPAARGLSNVLSGGRENTKQLNDQAAAALQLTETYEEFAAASLKIQEANKHVIAQYYTLTPLQYDYAKALIATGVAADEAVDRASQLQTLSSLIADEVPEQLSGFQALLDLIPGIERIPNTEPVQATLREMGQQILTLAERSDDAKAKLQEFVLQLRNGEISPDQFRELVTAMQADADATDANAAAKKRLADEMRAAEKAADALAEAQQELTTSILQAGTELTNAAKKRTRDLETLEERHVERVEELNADREQTELDIQQELTDAATKGAAERSKLETAYERERAGIVEEYAERREKLEAEHRERVATEDREFEREQQQAREAAQTQRIQDEASFVERLYGITRQKGGGGKAARTQAKAELAAAKAEADALLAETGDADAAQRLLAERQRQILEKLERKQEENKLKQDAKRGSKTLTPGDANEELAEVGALTEQAAAATIEQIKNEARARAQQRDEERQKRETDHQQQIEELNQDEADKLAQLDTKHQEQLQQFDEQQRERVAQIRKHGDEQLAAIDDQLAKEEASYKKSRDQIAREYDTFLAELKQRLQDEANQLGLSPDAKRQKELADAYAALGLQLGDAFRQSLETAANAQTLPSVPGANGTPTPNTGQPRPAGQSSGTSPLGRSYTRGSVVESAKDAKLSDQAIDQIATGARQSGSFNGQRGSDLHAGVDLATPENTPVKSPIDGQIVGVGATKAGGNYIKVQGATGDVWYFGHLNRALAAKGAQVKRGDVIARSGATGTAVTGPHVHVQLQPGGGRAADPTGTLEQLVGTSATTNTPAKSPAGSAAPASTPTNTPARAENTTANDPRRPSYQSAGALPRSGPSAPFTPAAPATNSTPTVAIDRSTTVDLRGATFAPGVSMDDVEQAVRRGASQVLDERQNQDEREWNQLAASGAYQPL